MKIGTGLETKTRTGPGNRAPQWSRIESPRPAPAPGPGTGHRAGTPTWKESYKQPHTRPREIVDTFATKNAKRHARRPPDPNQPPRRSRCACPALAGRPTSNSIHCDALAPAPADGGARKAPGRLAVPYNQARPRPPARRRGLTPGRLPAPLNTTRPRPGRPPPTLRHHQHALAAPASRQRQIQPPNHNGRRTEPRGETNYYP